MSKIGGFFKEITGRDPSEIQDILGVEKLAEERLGTTINYKVYDSSLVPIRGSMFSFDQKKRDLDTEVDQQLARMRKLCQKT